MSPSEAKETVLGVLTGQLTRDGTPWVFDDDVLLFAATKLSESDAEWLLAEILDRSRPFEVRLEVFLETRGEVRRAAAAGLRAEPPEHAVWKVIDRPPKG